MKYSVLLLGLFFLIFPLNAQGSKICDADDWKVTSLHADINIHDDGRVTFDEQISLEVFHDNSCSSFYRYIPKHSLRKLEARWDGEEVDVRLRSADKDHRSILIEDSERLSYPGTYVYTLSYEMSNLVAIGQDEDVFDWNIVPRDWDVSIRNTSASIDLPNNASIRERSCATDSDIRECKTSLTGSALTVFGDDDLSVHISFDHGIIRPRLLKRLFSFWWMVILLPVITLSIAFWRKKKMSKKSLEQINSL